MHENGMNTVVKSILSCHILYTLIVKKKHLREGLLPSTEVKGVCYHVWPTVILVTLKFRDEWSDLEVPETVPETV